MNRDIAISRSHDIPGAHSFLVLGPLEHVLRQLHDDLRRYLPSMRPPGTGLGTALGADSGGWAQPSSLLFINAAHTLQPDQGLQQRLSSKPWLQTLRLSFLGKWANSVWLAQKLD